MEKVWTIDKDKLGKKAYAKQVEVGKWYKFDCLSNMGYTEYGKVVEIKDGEVFAEKTFQLPDYRPYAETKWFDNLPMGIL